MQSAALPVQMKEIDEDTQAQIARTRVLGTVYQFPTPATATSQKAPYEFAHVRSQVDFSLVRAAILRGNPMDMT